MDRPLPAYETTVHLDAPMERTRQALTTLAGIRGWWSPIVTGNAQPGGELRVGFAGLGETITIAVVDTDRSTVDWLVREHSAAPDWAGSHIRFGLATRPGGCRLVLRHDGVHPDRVGPGWTHFLDSLRLLVQTGQGVPHPSSTNHALLVATRYHAAWTSGRFDDAIALLAADLETEVPINSYSSPAEWGQALVAFGSVVDRAELLSALGSSDQAVLLYDLHTEPYGVLRIAEHFTTTEGAIARIRHVHDTVAFREPTATAGTAP